jgi:hypothetical protein
MTIDSRWLQKDFKQKYYLFCREKEFKVEKFNSYVKKPYICRILIKDI